MLRGRAVLAYDWTEATAEEFVDESLFAYDVKYDWLQPTAGEFIDQAALAHDVEYDWL